VSPWLCAVIPDGVLARVIAYSLPERLPAHQHQELIAPIE
jgi:hypothetical protein